MKLKSKIYIGLLFLAVCLANIFLVATDVGFMSVGVGKRTKDSSVKVLYIAGPVCYMIGVVVLVMPETKK